jgi:hypothetical protein
LIVTASSDSAPLAIVNFLIVAPARDSGHFATIRFLIVHSAGREQPRRGQR